MSVLTNVPQFPSPPPREVCFLSRKSSPRARPVSFSFATRKRHASHEKKRPVSSYGSRKQRCKNIVYPRLARERGKCIRQRVTELRFKMTEPKNDVDQENINIENVPHTTVDILTSPMENRKRFSSEINEELEMPGTVSTGVQTAYWIPYRLRAFPSIADINDGQGSPKKSSQFCKQLRFLGRLSLSQIGLVVLLFMWAMIGASSFYATEGPRERNQTRQLKNSQHELAVDLAMELRQLKAKDEDMEPLWSKKVQQYMGKHEKVLLMAVSSGYGEGGEGGKLWTFPGCVLFSVSLLTTLGFGAPVPRSNEARIATVIFAAIGIPAHFLLVMNFGLTSAVAVQRYAIARKYRNKDIDQDRTVLLIPAWVKFSPFFCIGLYYIIGILGFGLARLRPFAASVLFPLDFTAAGGLATTPGLVRIFYAIYLEGAMTIAAVTVALLKLSATQSLTNVGLKYGLITCA